MAMEDHPGHNPFAIHNPNSSPPKAKALIREPLHHPLRDILVRSNDEFQSCPPGWNITSNAMT